MHRGPLNRLRDFDRWPALDPGQWLDFNPTLFERPASQGGGLMAIVRRDRYPPVPGRGTLWTVPVDAGLQPCGPAQPLVGRGEDPRALVIGERLLVSFCVIDRDGADAVCGSTMMLAEFDFVDGRPVARRQFALPKNPLRLARPDDRQAAWEKNWVPFPAGGSRIGLVYSHDPWHVIELDADPADEARRFVGHHAGGAVAWEHGQIRGGTPPLPFGSDRWITFFHASEVVGSRKVYSVGACTFDRAAPYTPRQITREPLIVAPYRSGAHRFGWAFAGSVVFPLGAIACGEGWRLLAGLDDGEVGHFTVSHGELAERLDPIDAVDTEHWGDIAGTGWSPRGPMLLGAGSGAAGPAAADLALARFARHLVGSGRTMVDWGAGSGVASVLLAPRFDRVLAFDDSPAARRRIERQARVNAMPQLTVHEPRGTLDGQDLQAVDLLRIDCPTDLPAILAGAAALLERCQPVLLLHLASEQGDDDPAIAWLGERGYTCRRLAVHHPRWLVAIAIARHPAFDWWI